MSKDFIRKDAFKRKRVNQTWRKPRGLQNKKRLQKKGNARKVKPGFGTKDADRHTTKTGLKIITITTIAQLKEVNPKTHAIIIGKTGMNKKLKLLDAAEKAKLTVTNLNIKKYKELTEEKLKEKKESAKERDTKLAEKAKSEEKKEKITEEKKKEAAKSEETEEEKKKREKEEKDKLLIKAK